MPHREVRASAGLIGVPTAPDNNSPNPRDSGHESRFLVNASSEHATGTFAKDAAQVLRVLLVARHLAQLQPLDQIRIRTFSQ